MKVGLFVKYFDCMFGFGVKCRGGEANKASPPAPLRRERGVVSHGNGGGHFGVN